ncbi:electron transport complex subunit RsxC [Bowmanella pacifica]|uniref:Ion-translocating oxidoreductase complex subunit C n=1 Tax=Bowmanella pacifica TaxID=502051 RepID=A0A917Z1A2_9ALTE|nr:electron transport complex subunit RsxC [Bowmanella pacifica]GGO72421.1 electron transport complex subunit C [Bowmanella pacifica]
MQSLIDKIRQGRFHDFPGGVHPPGRKEMSNQELIGKCPLPERLYLTIKQHIGTEGQLQVNVGDGVLKGQALTRSTNPFALPIHAPTSGKISAIAPHVSAHPSGMPELTVEIVPDGQDQWCELTPLPDYQQLPKIKIIEAICDAGIAGMGGAGFPTHIKVSPKKDVDFLIINGVECEPYITADDRLMREHAWQIRQGIDVLCHLLNPGHVLIAIEDNKPQAIQAMQVACQENPDYIVCSIPTKYPAGGEKQLIQVLTGREVPHGRLPIDVGVIMQNVGTCFAVADAIFTGKPLIQRVVTLTGDAMERPGNVWALLGTPVNHLLEQAGYQTQRQHTKRLIMGGPMMGFSLVSDQVPVVKSTNCILAPTDQEMTLPEEEQACIRCSACADACPVSLLPQQLYWHSKAKELDKAQDYHLFDCIECGACAYVCPSQIPLVHYYRVAKAQVRQQEEEKQKADKARDRFEARKDRLEQEKAERELKHQQAAEARRQAMASRGDNATDSATAALDRAKLRQQATSPTSETGSNDKVAAAIARAKARKEAQAIEESQATPEAQTPEQDKQDKVAAAIARAKAKKAAQAAENTDSPDSVPADTDKQAKVAAAVARAKARRAAQAAENTDAPDSAPADTDKQAKVAAAVARAKARKAAQAAENTDSPDSAPADINKQAKVAAAVARAKARKAAQAAENTDAPDSAPADTDKQAKVAAAVTKAKARKAAQTAGEDDADHAKNADKPTRARKVSRAASKTSAGSSKAASDDPKAQRIAAAIAQAKAQKAEKDKVVKQSDDEPASAPDVTINEDKKQRVAAAIAKAKARKAQQTAQNNAANQQENNEE